MTFITLFHYLLTPSPLAIPSPPISWFKVGPFVIHIYAITMLCAIIVASILTWWRWKKIGGTTTQILDLILIGVPSGLVGARIFNCITVPWSYFPPTGNLLNIFKVWDGGLAIFGGIIGGGIAVWLWSRHCHYSVLLFADCLAPAFLVAQAIGRLGNWFNQELYGPPTTLPWGLRLNNAPALGKNELCYTGQPCPNPAHTLFQPMFLYEIIWDLAGALILWLIRRYCAKKLNTGEIFALYLIWYGCGRAVIETYRINLSSEIFGIRINVWASLCAVLIGIILFIFLLFKGVPRKESIAQLKKVSHADMLKMKLQDKASQDITSSRDNIAARNNTSSHDSLKNTSSNNDSNNNLSDIENIDHSTDRS